jgi:hypothetical protein
MIAGASKVKHAFVAINRGNQPEGSAILIEHLQESDEVQAEAGQY